MEANCKNYLNHLLMMVVATTDNKRQDVVHAKLKAEVIKAIVDNFTPTVQDLLPKTRCCKNYDHQPCGCCHRFVTVPDPDSEDTHVFGTLVLHVGYGCTM